jgi:hypothetical protein
MDPQVSRRVADIWLMAPLRKSLAIGLATLVVTGAAATAGFARATAPDPKAVAYYTAYQATIARVAAAVLSVQRYSHQLDKTRTQASLKQLLKSIAEESTAIAKLSAGLAPRETTGKLGKAESDILAGAGQLSVALETLGTYLRSPKKATSTLFLSQYANGAARWNAAVRTVWALVQKSAPPVVPVPL